MRRIAFDFTVEDDEWRDMNFTDSEIASANQINARQPSAKELIKAAEKYGTDGILESAILLSQSDFKKVYTALQKLGA